MIRIALCDDDATFLCNLHQEIERWYKLNATDEVIAITEFISSSYLSQSLHEGRSFDLFLLDIEMPNIDGLSLGNQVRELMPTAIIIFLTSHTRFAPEGYKSRALRYVYKLNWKEQLPEALSAARAEFLRMENESLAVFHYNDALRIPFKEILYVRHVLRHTQIATENDQIIKDGRGLKEIHGLLDDPRFIFIERSTFINVDHLRQIKGNEVILRNGLHLPISRQMLAKVKETVNRLWMG